MWAVRIYKTRSDAAEGCRTNKVTVNGMAAKPSREVREGDRVTVRKGPVTYAFIVKGAVSGRVGAPLVADYAENVTPREELDKLSAPRETVFVSRDRGTGRPTKKERRDIEGLMDIFLDGDDQ